MRFLALILITLFAFVSPARAIEVNILRTDDFTFINNQCHLNDTCDLESVVFRVKDYRLPPDSSSDVDIYGTAFLAGMQTSSVESLRKYSIVQFIRGCMWTSYVGVSGTVENAFRVIRDSHLGERGLMVHREWTVDTGDFMPQYHGDQETLDKHYFLQWTDPAPAGIPPGQGHLLGEKQATVPFGFITDYPGPAVLRPSTVTRLEAQNSTMQFKTCVYKTSDVPTSTVFGLPSEFHMAPIVCYEWQQSYVYNHVSGVFESPRVPHPTCSRPFTADEEKAIKFLRLK